MSAMIRHLRAHYDTTRIRWQGHLDSRIGDFPVRVHSENRRPTLLLSTHFTFLPADQRRILHSALNELAAIYPRSSLPNEEILENSFPSLFFAGNESSAQ